MAVTPVAPGHVDYSSTGTSKFIPQIWSSKLVGKFYKSTVFGEITNTDYEGEIKAKGDKVIIRTMPEIVIKDYQKGQPLSYDSYESANTELTIDYAKWFGFGCEDVDKKQADVNYISKWSEDAALRMKIAIDSHVLSTIWTSPHAKNKGTAAGLVSASFNLGTTGSPVAISKDNVIDYIVDCGSVLSEQNVPESQRWLVIPTWMANYIKKSDLKDASLSGDSTSMLRNGRIGTLDQFTLYVSNNFTALTDSGGQTAYPVLFGHPSAVTFAAQMTQTETLRNPHAFGDLIRSLMVYGFKTIRSEGIGCLYCYKG